MAEGEDYGNMIFEYLILANFYRTRGQVGKKKFCYKWQEKPYLQYTVRVGNKKSNLEDTSLIKAAKIPSCALLTVVASPIHVTTSLGLAKSKKGTARTIHTTINSPSSYLRMRTKAESAMEKN